MKYYSPFHIYSSFPFISRLYFFNSHILAVDRALPNIKSYLCEVLKREKLSLEAEALRARYEAMLLSLEKVSRNAETLPSGFMRHSVGGISNVHVQLRSKYDVLLKFCLVLVVCIYLYM